jgi:hypothetical protein
MIDTGFVPINLPVEAVHPNRRSPPYEIRMMAVLAINCRPRCYGDVPTQNAQSSPLKSLYRPGVRTLMTLGH